MRAGTRVMGTLVMMIPRAMYFELAWKTGARMRVLKYMTEPRQCVTQAYQDESTRGDAAKLLRKLGDNDKKHCL